MKNYNRYQVYPTVNLKDRTWPNKKITKAPIWCSVDLRDGNQALVTPMGLSQKLQFFQLKLVFLLLRKQSMNLREL